VFERRRVHAAALLTALSFGFASGCDGGPTGVPPEGAIDLSLPWIQAAPHAVGLDANALFVAGEQGEGITRLRSLVVIRQGRLAYERYYGGATVDSLADVRSVTKSVVSALVGIAIDRGDIDGLDQPMTDFVEAPEFAVQPPHAAITVGHLLTMTSGFFWSENNVAGYNDWLQSGEPENYLLARPISALPGQSFTYNSAAVHLLSVLLEKAVEPPLDAFADEVLFVPLGIRRRSWEELSSGYVNGGSGLDLRPRDLAKFGQLYLQEGWSDQRSLIPAEWISRSTDVSVGNLGSVGPIQRLSYGFLWWLDLDRSAFFAWGFGGQFVYVAPHLDLVVVATTDWRGVTQDIGNQALQARVLSLIIDAVLPAAR